MIQTVQNKKDRQKIEREDKSKEAEEANGPGEAILTK